MSTTMKELGIDQMSSEERIALALEIWDSLGDDRPSPQPTAVQKAELARRDADLDASPEIGLTWEHVRAGTEK